MLLQKLDHVCSIRHLHGFTELKHLEDMFDKAIKASFRIVDSKTGLDVGTAEPGCACYYCQAIKRYGHPPQKTDKIKFSGWQYRLLMVVTDCSQRILVEFLEDHKFTTIQTYVGYENNPAIIWTLHIPTYIKENKFSWIEDSYLLPKKEIKNGT